MIRRIAMEHGYRPLRYAMVGGFGVLVNMAVLAVLFELASQPLWLSSAIAIEAAIISNFIGNHRFTFPSANGSLRKRFFSFQTISLATAALSWFILNGLAFVFGTEPSWIVYGYNALAIAIGFIANYGLNSSVTWPDDLASENR